MAPILVTGGTGTLGRAVTSALADPRVLSRRPSTDPRHVRGDLATGAGLAEALDGVDTVVHCATTMRGRGDVAIAERLVAASGDRHLVFVSIVGVDRVRLPYYRGKLAAEEVVARRPHTILRATQFHDLIRTVLAGAATLPVMPVPAIRVQPVDVRDVAARLAELATGSPRGRVPYLGGPAVRPVPDLAAEYLAVTGRRRPLLRIPVPGKAFRDGANLAGGGTITFGEYLGEHPAPRAVSYRRPR